MKKIIYTLLFVSTAILTSCGSDDDSSSDDDGSTNLSNEISIDGEISDLTSGLVEEYGTGIEEGYYNNDFTLSGEIDGEAFFLYAELFSIEEGNDDFTVGTFVFDNDDDDNDASDYYFDTALISYDGETSTNATAGTVTISGTSPDYTFEANLTLSDGTEIEAQYSGDFTVTAN